MAKFDDYTQDMAEQLIETPVDYEERKDLLDGDHWLKGKGFTGPMEDVGGDEFSQTLRKGISKNFTSENVIGEVSQRRVDGVLSKDPQFKFQVARYLEKDEDPTDDETRRLEEASEAARIWWREQGIYDTFHEFAFFVCGLQKCYLRLYVPSDRLNKDGTLKYPVSSPAEALEHIFVEIVLPSDATLYTDKRSMYKLGVVVSEFEIENKETEKIVELSYLDPNKRNAQGKPKTVIRTIAKNAATEARVTVDLNGRLTLFEGKERRPFITRQIIENQKALNTASTEMRIVNDSAGFPMRIIFNAIAPGTLQRDEQTGELKFTPDPNFQLRPNSLSFFQGTEVENDEQNVRDVKQPSAHTFEPAVPKHFIDEMQKRRQAILNEAKQLFVEIMDDATATGESRIHALFDYLLNAQYFKRIIDRAGEWAISTAWALATHLAGEPGRDADLTVDFNAKINIPFLPAALVQSLLLLMEKGVRSRFTVMNDTGIDDVESELDRINETPQSRLQLEKLSAEAVKAWVDAGAGLEVALERIGSATGIDKDEIRKMLRSDDDLLSQIPQEASRANGTEDEAPPLVRRDFNRVVTNDNAAQD